VTVQDGVAPVPKAKVEVINLLAKEQEAKGLIVGPEAFHSSFDDD